MTPCLDAITVAKVCDSYLYWRQWNITFADSRKLTDKCELFKIRRLPAHGTNLLLEFGEGVEQE